MERLKQILLALGIIVVMTSCGRRAPTVPHTGDATSPGPSPDGGSVPGTWVTIAKGTFGMGAHMSESCVIPPTETHHPVTLTNDYEIQSTETTQGAFQLMMGYNPSHFGPNGSRT